jgi:hypothetical protein
MQGWQEDVGSGGVADGRGWQEEVRVVWQMAAVLQ